MSNIEKLTNLIRMTNDLTIQGKELTSIDPYGKTVTLAKVAHINLKQPKQPKDLTSNYVPYRRVSFRPYCLVNHNSLSDKMVQETVILKDFSPEQYKENPLIADELALVGAFYSTWMPYFYANKHKYASLEFRNEFVEGIQTVINAPFSVLEKIAEERNIEYEAYNSLLNELFHSAFTDPKWSLSELVDQIKISTGGKLATNPATVTTAARSRVAATVRAAAKRGGIGVLNRRTVRAIVNSFGDNAPPWVHTPAAQRGLSMLVPILGQFMLDFDVNNRIPTNLKSRLGMMFDEALASEVDHATGEVAEQILDTAWPLLENWIAEARALENLVGEGEEEDEQIQPAPRVRETEKVSASGGDLASALRRSTSDQRQV